MGRVAVGIDAAIGAAGEPHGAGRAAVARVRGHAAVALAGRSGDRAVGRGDAFDATAGGHVAHGAARITGALRVAGAPCVDEDGLLGGDVTYVVHGEVG